MNLTTKSKLPLLALGLISGAVFTASPVFGQAPASTVTVDAATMERLLKRVDELEAKSRRLDQLEGQLGELKQHALSAPPAVAAPVDAYPRLDFHVLGSLDLHASNVSDEAKQFELGDIDIVLAAKLSERASVITDLVVASNHGGFSTEIERLVASYKFNDSLNLDMGRFHTAIGWYNNFYHNGNFFQTTADRPQPLMFEDNGGILPVHSVGVSLNGDLPSGDANLSYSFEVANGRNYTADEHLALDVADDNNYKSFNLQVRAKPGWLDSWQFGAGIYHDTLTPELSPGQKTRVDQFILSAYAVYKTGNAEWLTEGFAVGDAPRNDHRHWTGSAYTQVSEKFGRCRPYVRLQWRAAAAGDPVLALIGQNTSVWGPQVGVRYDFSPMMAVKFEIDRNDYQHESSVNEFITQLTFRY